jgi:hypothetical protein
MIQAFDSYRVYQSVKLHFTSNTYDCFRYQFKTNVNQKTFWKRNDRYFFHKSGLKFKTEVDLANFYASHIISDIGYITDMIESDDTYLAWLKKIQSITRVFAVDMETLSNKADSFDELFVVNGNYPVIIDSLLRDEVSLETVTLINSMTNFLRRADKQVTETILYPELSRKIKKYAPFIRADQAKMKRIILNTYAVHSGEVVL